MPYESTAELPSAVREHLPPHGQEIYRSAFNHAWASYAARADREEVAHRVAWAAVKRRYRKSGGVWVANRAGLEGRSARRTGSSLSARR